MRGEARSRPHLAFVDRALEEAARQIIPNPGIDGAAIPEELEEKAGSISLDVAAAFVEGLVGAGTIDPAKSTTSLLRTAIPSRAFSRRLRR